VLLYLLAADPAASTDRSLRLLSATFYLLRCGDTHAGHDLAAAMVAILTSPPGQAMRMATLYLLMWASLVTSVRSSHCACATSIRSKGSRWIRGSRPAVMA
jgi:hypothetical protein